jgi:hypothetical protein
MVSGLFATVLRDPRGANRRLVLASRGAPVPADTETVLTAVRNLHRRIPVAGVDGLAPPPEGQPSAAEETVLNGDVVGSDSITASHALAQTRDSGHCLFAPSHGQSPVVATAHDDLAPSADQSSDRASTSA